MNRKWRERLDPRIHAWLRGILILSSTLTTVALLASDHEAAVDSYREGNGLFDQDRFGEAVAAYNRAIAQDPQFAEAFHNRALAEEMVDREKAKEAWRRFIEVAQNKPELKFDVARARARSELLDSKPPLPASLQPGRFVPSAGDYYWKIAKVSEGEQWTELPVKVYLGSPGEIKWLQGAREAYNIWSAVFPMQLVALPERADIRIDWGGSVQEQGHAGEELEWVRMTSVGDALAGRRVAQITLDLSRRWSKDEMRAIILHEMGHALGIKEHSDSRKDIMYWQMQEKEHPVYVPVYPAALIWRSLVKNPSQRDVNTLIRLYNSAGPMERFP